MSEDFVEEVPDEKIEEVNGDDKAQMEKAKMSIIYVGMASVIMFFGGMTSAYIVSMGDAFWIKFPFPTAFWISTVLILLSSLVFQYSISSVKKGNIAGLKIGVSVTLLLGIAFVFTQILGYKQLGEAGSHLTGSGIIVSDGKYGDYYTIKQNNDFIEVDGNNYSKQGKKLTEKEMSSLKSFTKQFVKPQIGKNFKVKDDGIHELYWEGHGALINVNGILQTNDTVRMQNTDRNRLSYLALNIQDERGDFFMRGEIVDSCPYSAF